MHTLAFLPRTVGRGESYHVQYWNATSSEAGMQKWLNDRIKVSQIAQHDPVICPLVAAHARIRRTKNRLYVR